MPTYRLTLEYEGTRYRGWQEQRDVRTVAGELRRALEPHAGPDFELGGAGRTDAGVHALEQVAHLRCRRRLGPLAEVVREVAERLPADIHLLRLEPAAGRFHARHDAERRSYLYQVSRRRTALAKRFVWWVRRPLDDGAISRAAAAIAGDHDFAAFCEKPQAQTSTRVVVDEVEVATAGDLVLVRIVASHFLWKMVRRLVGTLVEVGAGELGPDDLSALIAGTPGAPDFRPAEHTAPPSGLFLERVLYAGEPPLGALVAAVPVAPARRGAEPAAAAHSRSS
jgi:tRNA pseudouridine38-40 synthase